MTDRQYLASLSSFPGFGLVRIKLLVKYFGNAKKVWESDTLTLRNLNIGEKLISDFVNYRERFNSEVYFRNLEKHSIKFCTLSEEDYPVNLREIDNPPPVLYYIGILKKSEDIKSVAIVGSRNMSQYGKEAAYKLSAELSECGFTIVSGLAFGIDAVAHRACIDKGGRGIVVLASGLDTISPLTNKWIAEKIVEKGGVIVSEYPLGTIPVRTNFPIRNRIVSGLSKGVIVIEAGMKSGTMHTVAAAAEQGRTVFAVPGSIFSPLSFAPHYLIQNGAKLINSAKDVVDELDS